MFAEALNVRLGLRLRIVGVAVSPDSVAYPLASSPIFYLDYRDVAPLIAAVPGTVDTALIWLANPDRVDVTLSQAVDFGTIICSQNPTACLTPGSPYGPFGGGDAVVIGPGFRSTLPEAERLDVPELVRDLAAAGVAARELPSVEAIVATVAREAREGDDVLVMSNGGFGGIHGKLLEALV